MSKTVKEIAEEIGYTDDTLIKLKQRIRDEIKRKSIATTKRGNRFLISDKDALAIVKTLSVDLKKEEIKESSNDKEDIIKDLRKKLKEKEDLQRQKDEEISRLNRKIEEFAVSFKEMSEKQLQLTNQEQQLQAKILEQTQQLRKSQQLLLESTEKASELQEKVDKVQTASLWQRITKKF